VSLPLSVKGVLIEDGCVALLENERGEWELPGGRLEPGEDLPACLAREFAEELGIAVAVGAILDCHLFEVLPARHVVIVAYAVERAERRPLQVSAEHRRCGWFALDALDDLALPAGYRRAIRVLGAPAEEPAWLGLARELQAIAQTGLFYSRDKYDTERYEQVRTVATEIMALGTAMPVPSIRDLFRQDVGYATPRVDVRGAAFRDGRVLMVRERNDGRWSLPGGWADVNCTAAENVEREIVEESGFTARAVKLAMVLDRRRQGHRPPQPFHVYKMFFVCEITGGVSRPSLETSEVGFFAEDALPELSPGRISAAQIRRMFEHHRRPGLAAEFD